VEKADDELEIDEVNLSLLGTDAENQPQQQQENRKYLLLATRDILKEEQKLERYACPIWTQGLERTFKVRQASKFSHFIVTSGHQESFSLNAHTQSVDFCDLKTVFIFPDG